MRNLLRGMGWIAAAFCALLALAAWAAGLVYAPMVLAVAAWLCTPLAQIRAPWRVAGLAVLTLAWLVAVGMQAPGADADPQASPAPASWPAVLGWIAALGALVVGLRRLGGSAPQARDAQTARLLGLCQGILADDRVSQEEALRLQAALADAQRWRRDPRTAPLLERLQEMLRDGRLDEGEAAELRTALGELCDALAGGAAAGPARTELRQGRRPPPSSATVQVEAPRSGDHFLIGYEDATGATSEREIRYIRTERQRGRVYVRAYCLHRQALRTFRADRIRWAARTDTGEVIADTQAYFGAGSS